MRALFCGVRRPESSITLIVLGLAVMLALVLALASTALAKGEQAQDAAPKRDSENSSKNSSSGEANSGLVGATGAVSSAPTILSTDPSPEEKGQLRSVSPTITFSEPMNADSVKGFSNIQLAPEGTSTAFGPPIGITCNSDTSCTQVTIDPYPNNPLSVLKKKKWYSLTFWIDGAGIKDLDDNILTRPEEGDFFPCSGGDPCFQYWFKTGQKK